MNCPPPDALPGAGTTGSQADCQAAPSGMHGGGLNCWKADPGATFVQNPSPITVLSGIAQEGEEEGEDSTGKLSFLATFCTCLRLLLLKFY